MKRTTEPDEERSAEPTEAASAKDGATQRRVSGRAFGLLNAVLLLSLAFQLNYLSFRHYERWDWTEHSIYTLSERTKAVLRELEQPVEIWILLSEAEPEFAELRNLLGRYEAESERIDVHYVDPDRDPGGYREVAQRFELGAMLVGERQLSDVAAVVQAGERHWEITRDDLISARVDPMGDRDEIELDVESERALTGALVELATGRPTKVCLTTGHGEFALSGASRSLSGFASEMRRENLELEEIETRGQSRVPEGCDALAVVGPEVAFTEAEAELLRGHVRSGGNLLVALDPIPNPGQTSFVPLGLEGALRDLGVRVDRSIVIEPNQALWPAGIGNPIGPFAAVGWGEHAITEPFRGQRLPLVVSEVRSVRLVDEARGSVLVSTSEQSYAETNLRTLQEGPLELGADEGDVEGPVPIAVATTVEVLGREPDDGEERRTGGRIVALGDATMFASEYLGEPTVVNRSFASAVVGWLTQRQALISIEPRTIRHQPVSMSEEDVFNLGIRVVVLIPLAFVFLGFAVWWNRRQ